VCSGIIEEYLPEQKRTTGDARIVYHQPTLAEGPNIYHLEDGYLLLLAEGGTGWNHGITAARATDIFGPYERDPEYAVITTRDAPGSPLAKAGHGELVQTQDGHWLMVHLASRPTLELGSRFCTLGRETALQRLAFQDGWPRLAQGGILPAADVDLADIERLAPAEETVAVPPTVPAAEPSAPTGTFGTELDLVRFATLRAAPDPAVFDLTTRPGRLHLHAGQSAWSVFSQSMLLERVTEHHSRTTVTVDAEPTEFRQAAGLIAWYDRNSWIWLQVTADEENGRHLRVVRRDGGTHVSEPIAVPDGPLELAAEIDGPTLQFRFRAAGAGGNGAKGTDGVDWQDAAGPQPFWQLSDDHGTRLRFTGAFIGVRAESLNGTAWVADFTEPVTEAEEQLGPGVPGQVPGHAAEYVQS
jgi:xylan 1,4-beta-xylosidase